MSVDDDDQADWVCAVAECEWGTGGNPAGRPKAFCGGFGSWQPECAINWLSADPADLEPYGEYLRRVRARVRYCEVCAEQDCHADRTIPEPAPFTATTAGGEVWYNIPQTCNWNWYSPERDGLYSWIDLLHMTHPDAPAPASVKDAAWCCGEHICSLRRSWRISRRRRLSSLPPAGCCTTRRGSIRRLG